MRRWGSTITASLAVTAIALLLAACGGGDGLPTSDPDDWSAAALEPDLDAPVAGLLINSNLGVGPTRLSIALIDPENAVVTEAEVRARFFWLETEPGSDVVVRTEFVAETALAPRTIVPSVDHFHADGSVHAHDGAPTGVFTAQIDFDRDGWWGAELDVDGAAVEADDVRFRLFVRDDTLEPSVGDPAPPSRQTVAADVDDLGLIDTSIPPNPAFHDITVADAIASGRPAVVAFATPAFCQTRFCGPVLQEAVAPLADRFGDDVHIIHIEPFDLARAGGGELVPAPELAEWGLVTEPWVFIVDAEGRIAAKFEGIVEFEELEAVVAGLLAGG